MHSCLQDTWRTIITIGCQKEARRFGTVLATEASSLLCAQTPLTWSVLKDLG